MRASDRQGQIRSRNPPLNNPARISSHPAESIPLSERFPSTLHGQVRKIKFRSVAIPAKLSRRDVFSGASHTFRRCFRSEGSAVLSDVPPPPAARFKVEFFRSKGVTMLLMKSVCVL